MYSVRLVLLNMLNCKSAIHSDNIKISMCFFAENVQVYSLGLTYKWTNIKLYFITH